MGRRVEILSFFVGHGGGTQIVLGGLMSRDASDFFSHCQ